MQFTWMFARVSANVFVEPSIIVYWCRNVTMSFVECSSSLDVHWNYQKKLKWTLEKILIKCLVKCSRLNALMWQLYHPSWGNMFDCLAEILGAYCGLATPLLNAAGSFVQKKRMTRFELTLLLMKCSITSSIALIHVNGTIKFLPICGTKTMKYIVVGLAVVMIGPSI